MPTLANLAKRVVETSIKKGFDLPRWGSDPEEDDPFPRLGASSNYLAKLMLVVTEIDEAVDSAPHRDEFAEELADVAIRTLGILSACHAKSWAATRIENRSMSGLQKGRPVVWDRPEVVLWAITKYVVRAAECWRTDDRKDAGVALELALLETFRIADRCGIDLMAAIEAKDAKNQTREHQHGKKAAG